MPARSRGRGAARRRRPRARPGCGPRRRQRAGAAALGDIGRRAATTARCGSAASTSATSPGARHPGVRAGRGRLAGPRGGFRDAFRRAFGGERRRLLRGQGVPVHGGRPLDGRGRAGLDICTRRRARGGAARRRAAGADRLARQQQVGRRDRPGAVAPASAGSSSTRSTRSTGWPAAGRAVRPAGAGAAAGDRGRRGAHPRVHRDRARGPEVRPLPGRRPGRARPCDLVLGTSEWLELRGLHSHIGSQIFDTRGLRGRGPPAARPARRSCATSVGRELPELDLGGGFGIAYTTQHDPLPPDELADGLAEIVVRECAAARRGRARGSRSSPAGRSPGRARSRCTRWARSRRSSSTAA